MATTPKVLLKRSSVVGRIPVAGDLQYGELAINFQDGKIYYKDASNNIRAFVDSDLTVSLIQELSLDSSQIISLIDSSYVQARQDYAYASLTGAPDIQGMIDSEVTVLIGGSIPALDTLKELADAINNDPDVFNTLQAAIEDQLDSAEVIALVDSAYVQQRQDYAYSSLTGVPTNVSQFANDAHYLDSNTVLDVIDTTYVNNIIDSSTITDVINNDITVFTANVDSAYVQQRQDYAYASLTGTPDIPQIVRDNSLDSIEAQAIIDSNFQNLSQSIIPNANSTYDLGSDTLRFKDLYLSGNSLILGSLTITDSDGVLILRTTGTGDQANFAIDSQVQALINQAYIQSKIDKTFIDTLNIDADTLDGQEGSWYRDWANTTNKPTILDGIDVSNIITADVDKAFVDALNVDADTLDGFQASYFTDKIDSAINALIDGAPGALDTLNELAAALNDDSQAYNTLLASIAALPDSAQVASIITAQVDKIFVDNLAIDADELDGHQGSYYIDYDNFVNTPNVLDSADIQAFTLDSAEVIALIDSAHVQARQDYAYASLTGAPDIVAIAAGAALDSAEAQGIIDSNFQNLSQSIIPSGSNIDLGTLSDRFRDLYLSGSSLYIGNIKITDSNGLLAFRDLSGNPVDISTVDSAYVQLRQDYAYSSLTGVPTNVSQFANDAGYITTAQSTDSAEVQAIIDSDFAQRTTDELSEGQSNLYYTTARADSDFDIRLATKTTTDVAEGNNLYYTKVRVDSDIAASLSDSLNEVTITINNTIEDKVDSAYVLARVAEAPFLDSADAINLIDSAYVQQRQDYAYASLTGVPTLVSQFTNDAEYISTGDSAILSHLDVTGDIVIDGSLTVGGTSTTLHAVNLAVSDNMIYMNQGILATIDSAGGDGVTQTYTAENNYVSGMSVTITGITPSSYNVYGGTIDSAYPTYFTVAGSVTDLYVSGGSARAKTTTNPDLGFAAGYNDGEYHHTGFFRDASDGVWKVFQAYDPEPDESPFINTADSSFELADFQADDIIGNTLTGVYLGFDSDFASKTTSNLTEGSNLYYTTTRANAAIDARVTKTFVDALNVDADTLDGQDGSYYLDYTNVTSKPNILDSANVSSIIVNDVDAAYVQARQDYAYSSLTGVPTNVSQFTNDAGYITDADALDSAEIINLIDSAYVQARQTPQDFAYASLTGAPNVLDSANVIAIHNSLDVYRDSAFVTNIIDSAYINARVNSTDSAAVIGIINNTVDKPFVEALGIDAGLDSAAVISLVDSAYIQARVAAGTDSATVVQIIGEEVDSAYVQARQLNEVAAPLTQVNYSFTATAAQSQFTGLNIDSDKFQVYLNGLLLPVTDYTQNSSTLDLVVAADSGDILNVIKFSGNDTGAQAIQQRHYIYTATSGQTIFTGADDNGTTLSYTEDRINVYLNGLLLLDSDDYTQNEDGTTVTFTSGVTAGHIVNIQTLSGNTGTFAPLEQTLYEFTADSGQTIFSGTDNNAATLDFSQDKITVYLNGILLSAADYTASDNIVTLDVGADSGNLITVAKLSGNNIGLDSGQVNALIAAVPTATDSATVLSLINDYIIRADSDLTTTDADQVIDTFSASAYRTAKYIVQMSHTSGYHSSEILLAHDGSSVYMTTYADIITASSLGTIDADISGGNVRLLVTPTNTNTSVDIARININV